MKSNVLSAEPNASDTLKTGEDTVRLTVESFGMTDAGKVRETNQDQFLIATLRKTLRVRQTSLSLGKVRHSTDESHLFVVADGMGGHAGGEHASALAVDAVEAFVLETFKWFSKCKGREQDQILADFQSAVGQANARVLAEGHEHPDLRGMGTTLTLAYSLNDTLFVAHAGDSRCYLYRNGDLHRLTRDHTLVEDMVRRGGLSPEDASKHRLRHVVTNAVGGDSPELEVELHKVHLEPGDAILLCSDGLTEMLPDHEIADVLATMPDAERACEKLVARANDEGGKDNITAIVARYEAAEEDIR
jgi:serine/threonine protein phosphatase PrpC